MGKITGFLEYDRRELADRPPLERVRDWEPFRIPLTADARREQGGRCMNCGVPFCQSGIRWEGRDFGCPLHNLIPEWNDMIHAGNPSHALSRLLKTNNFPEFTGRVCPAPCEEACICGMYGDAVTIRDNELSVIEEAFAAGAVRRRRPPQWSGKKVAVVGSGPAGLAAADPQVAQRLLRDYDAVILCCGAERPRPLGLETEGISGICYGTEFLKAAVEQRQFGKTPAVPTAEGRDVIIIGTGDTASDCVATALRQGCRSIAQLVRRPEADYLQNGVLPRDCAHEEAAALFGEDPRRFGVQIKEIRVENGALTAVTTTEGDALPCGLLIAATGFAGCAGEVCKAFGVAWDETVRTSEGGFATTVEKVFAAGDMRRGQSLVVWAIAEGRSAAAEVDSYLNGCTNLVRVV